MIHRYCISHKKPLLPDSWYDHCISLGEFAPESALHVRNLDHFWHEARPIAYGAAGSYVVPIAVDRFSRDADIIEISSCRKRVLRQPTGDESKIFPTLRELEVTNTEVDADLSLRGGGRNGHDFLIAHPLYIKNTVFEHYASIHHRRDFLDYVSIAVETGVLNASSKSEFMAEKYFIPGGIELGAYPRQWHVDTLSQLELVSRRFLNQHGGRVRGYNKYQIRAVGFLSERLGSFILLRHLIEKYSNNIPAEVFGHMTVIVESESTYSAGVADSNKSNWIHRKLGRTR